MSSATANVSVVVPCRNYGRFLGEALDSILAQTLAPAEILVVDDGSTDDTPDVAARYGEAVRVLRVEGRGAYGARNDSLEHLSGDYFLNVDADNRLHPEFLERTLPLLENAPPHIGYVYTQRKYFGHQDGISQFPEFSREGLLLQGFVDMGSLIRMSLVRQFRFNEAFNRGQGDRAFFLTLLREGIEGILCPAPLLEYRVHTHSITSRLRQRCDQIPVQKLLLREFPDLFTPEHRRALLRDARNRTLVSLIENRRREAPFPERFRDTLLFARYGLRHAEFPAQIRHLFHPAP